MAVLPRGVVWFARKAWIRALAAALGTSLLACARPGAAPPAHPCLEPAADCTLRQIADAAGVRVGAAAQPGFIASDPLYGPTLAAEFNSLTPENEMKWPAVHPADGVYDFAPADDLVAFARANGMRVRGHNLVWADPARIPAWVAAVPEASTLHAILDEHIRTVVGRYAGQVDAWDVVNEPLERLGADLYSNVFSDLLGPDYIAQAFQIAHEADPDARLFLNEVRVATPNARFDAFYDLVAGLVADGVPIDGVGLQGHVIEGSLQPTAEGLRKVIQAFGDLGLVVEITEFDVIMTGNGPRALEVQGALYQELLSACLELAACQGITFWGLTDRYTWIDGVIGPGRIPLPLDADYGRKPAYEGARRALLGRLAMTGRTRLGLAPTIAASFGAVWRGRR